MTTTTTSVPSATTWGSPSAAKHALLLHGLTSSSHTWHRVASSLADKGYFVTAPNLVGHGYRTSSDYGFAAAADDLRPYLGARHYSLIVGHSWGTVVTLNLFPLLQRSSRPTAIVLVDPPKHHTLEELDFLDAKLAESVVDVKPADDYGAENPLWTREDNLCREFGTRMCSVQAVHGVLNTKSGPWHHFDLLDAMPEKCKLTVLIADPAREKIRNTIETFRPYPHVRVVMVPGAGHWIQYEFPEVIVEEALKRVAELDVA